MLAWLQLMRPHQWVKNGFVLVGVIFGHPSDVSFYVNAALGLLAFCLASSSVYMANDALDVESDRAHPKKARRPVASGAISETAAWTGSGLLAAIAVALAALIGWGAMLTLAAYFVLNLTYSTKLKHVVIVDVFSIAFGFMLRIIMGTGAIGIPPSGWMMFCGFMLTLFLGFAKRRSEFAQLAQNGQNHARRVLRNYDLALLDQFVSITAASTIISYGIYAATVASSDGTLLYTVPFVVFGVMRFLYLLHCEQGGQDTTDDLLRDPTLLGTSVAWMLLSGVILWQPFA